MPGQRAFASLQAQARRLARRSDEADDLLQSALLAALEAGRTDLTSQETRRWLSGVLRNRAAFDARTSARRKRRESSWIELLPRERHTSEAGTVDVTLSGLPPGLRLVALLALSGHTRHEIKWLLSLSDVSLRQRISQLKRALANVPAPEIVDHGSKLAFGRIRRALLAPARRENAFLGSHDPDGHLFVVSRSQMPQARQQTGA
jgi:DNA-directed RNA polymerase specialized sigma24 family protein